MFHRESFHSKNEIRRLLVIESKVTPKVYSVEVTHGFLGDGEPLMVCNPREEMVIKIDNTRWVFYQIFDSILGFYVLYLTVSSQQLLKGRLVVGRQKLKLKFLLRNAFF